MKSALLTACLSLLAVCVYADFYRVNVTRIAQDQYRDELSGGIIRTRGCNEQIFKSEAVLSYERGAKDNKIIFRSGTSCEVVGVYQ